MTISDWEQQQNVSSNVTSKTQCKVHQLLECQQKARRDKRHAILNDVNEDKPVDNPVLGEESQQDGLFSRMMTKRQLSEMALGVRDLSKRLGKIKLKINVKTVFLLTKIVDKKVIRETRALAEWLLNKDQERPYIVYARRQFSSFENANL